MVIGIFWRLWASVFIVFFCLAEASAGFLQVIKSTTTQANFVLYSPENLNAHSRGVGSRSQDSVYRYKQQIWKTPELKRFVPTLELDQVKGVIDKKDISRPQVLLLANAPKNDSERTRLENAFIRPFAKMGADVYMLPIGAALGLNKVEKAEFFDLISLHFDLMISNGGDDVHPALYDEKITHSVDTNEARDRAESEVIRAYIDRARGFFFGVCRGMQLTAVTYGMKMYQDIPIEVGSKVAHGGGGFRFHDIKLQGTKNSLLKQMIGEVDVIQGFSWHHQAVKTPSENQSSVRSESIFEIAGADVEDQFPEILESKNGKVLLTQFHPEYSRRIDALGGYDRQGAGLKILEGLFKQAQKSSRTTGKSCRQVF